MPKVLVLEHGKAFVGEWPEGISVDTTPPLEITDVYEATLVIGQNPQKGEVSFQVAMHPVGTLHYKDTTGKNVYVLSPKSLYYQEHTEMTSGIVPIGKVRKGEH